MEYQIILLPRQNYWAWVRACHDYVMAYGANLTGDPEMAARYMAPRQVVTLPLVAGAYPGQGDIVRWFERNHPEVLLDAIEVKSPDELREVFKRRIEMEDRYGRKDRPFYLLWPTDYPVITQKFGANPQIYLRFGMPGHEGLDIRALPNTNVYCCADGVVYRVHSNPKSHPYGIHVRVRHQDGYKTVYAHLARALVREGEAVKAGQVIGKADSTGASTASHLHMTLKREGASRRGETRYPKDVIDPTPFMVWPDRAARKSIEGHYTWPAGKCLVGAVGRIGGPLEEEDLAVIERARLEAVVIGLSERRETLERLRATDPAMFFLLRLETDLSDQRVTPDQFVSQVAADLDRLYRLEVRYVEFPHQPNLQLGGWGRSFRNGDEYAEWFQAVLEPLRRDFPEAKFGFPCLSPGEAISGWREDAARFLEDAEAAVIAADWIGVSACWTAAAGMRSPKGGRAYEQVRLQFPEKLIFVTEFANVSADTPPEAKATQYLEYYRDLRTRPGMGAAFANALSAAAGHEGVVWRGKGEKAPGVIAEVIGRRTF